MKWTKWVIWRSEVVETNYGPERRLEAWVENAKDTTCVVVQECGSEGFCLAMAIQELQEDGAIGDVYNTCKL